MRGRQRLTLGSRTATIVAISAILAWNTQLPRTQNAGLPGGASAPGPIGAYGMNVQRDRDLGPTDPGVAIEFTIVLRQPEPEKLRAFLSAISDPTSAEFRRFLTADEFGLRFGLTASQIDEVSGWLEAQGFTVLSRPPQRTSLAVRGTAKLINATFSVSMRDRADEFGRPYRAPNGPPHVPAHLSKFVEAVAALNSRGPEPAGGPIPAAVPGGRLLPADMARAYEIDELHAAGLHGEGQTIGIVSFDTFSDADILAYDKVAQISELGGGAPPSVRKVRLPGAKQAPGDGSGEVNLDIDVIRAIAPRAQIINYEAPNGPFGPVIREIVSRQEVDIVSISWGGCERKESASERIADDREFEAAAATGISIFVASGDHGAQDCRFWPPKEGNSRYRDLGLSVTSPANPSVILVGGTYLSVRTDGTYLQEAGWEDALTGWATGGGVSTVYAQPAWQRGTGVDNKFSTGMRQVPDVAGPADSDSGFLVVYTQAGEDAARPTTVGGTSAAAPFWAASMLLARQLAEGEGVKAGGFGRLGALGPLLYQLAASATPGDIFHDVLRGGNLYYDAGVGWDYATGLGTPRVGPLARAIVNSLR
jgi:kumamolisin